MSNQLLQAAINAKDILESVAYWMMNPDSITSSANGVYLAISQLDAAITIAQRQEQMQAAESFDSAEGSPICVVCGCEMVADYDGNDQIIGWDCMNCGLGEHDFDCGHYHESDEPCYGHTPYMPEWYGVDAYATEQYILDSIADERASEESYRWWLEGLYNSPKYLDYLAYLRREWHI